MPSEEIELTKEDKKFFKKVFDRYDHKRRGEITSKELGLVLKALGMDLTETELTDLINEVDRDGNGSIDFDEFMDMMARKMKESRAIREGGEGPLKEAFHVFDKNGDGFIGAAELKLVMESLGERVTKEDVDAMIKWADEDGDGRISYDEFKKLKKRLE